MIEMTTSSAQTYFDANPDVSAWANQQVKNGTFTSTEDAAGYHANTYGYSENRVGLQGRYESEIDVSGNASEDYIYDNPDVNEWAVAQVENGTFVANNYLEANPDVNEWATDLVNNNVFKSTTEAAEWHFKNWGYNEIRPGSPEFDISESAIIKSDNPINNDLITNEDAIIEAVQSDVNILQSIWNDIDPELKTTEFIENLILANINVYPYLVENNLTANCIGIQPSSDFDKIQDTPDGRFKTAYENMQKAFSILGIGGSFSSAANSGSEKNVAFLNALQSSGYIDTNGRIIQDNFKPHDPDFELNLDWESLSEYGITKDMVNSNITNIYNIATTSTRFDNSEAILKGRYSVSTPDIQSQLRATLGEDCFADVDADDPRPIAIVAYNESDYNGAFTNSHIDDLTNAYRVVYYDISNETNMISSIQEASSSKKADLLIIGAHGGQGGFMLGYGTEESVTITNTSLDDNKEILRNCLNDNSSVALISCSTGKGVDDTSGIDNVAEFFHDLIPQSFVYAPKVDTNIFGYSLNSDGFFASVNYNSSEDDILILPPKDLEDDLFAISTAYTEKFGKDSSNSESNYWIKEMQQGFSKEDIIASF